MCKRLVWLGAALFASGCAPLEPVPVARPEAPPASVSVPSAAAPPRHLTLDTRRATEAPRDVPAEILDRRTPVETVTVPVPLPSLALGVRRIAVGRAATIAAIDASSAHDVWLLDRVSSLFRAQGSALVPVPFSCSGRGTFGARALRASAEQIWLAGTTLYETAGVPRPVAAFASAAVGATGVRGAWRCEDYPAGDTYDSEIDWTLLPGAAWAVARGEHDPSAWSSDGDLFAFPRPGESGYERVLWHMADRAHGWLLLGACGSGNPCTGSLWELRGAGWMPRPGIEDLGLRALWLAPDGTGWAVGRGLAFYREGRWHRIALPDDFDVSLVSGARSGEVWLADEHHLYRFDGTTLSVAPAPISRIGAITYVEGSGLWVGGGPDAFPEGAPVPAGEVVIASAAPEAKP